MEVRRAGRLKVARRAGLAIATSCIAFLLASCSSQSSPTTTSNDGSTSSTTTTSTLPTPVTVNGSDEKGSASFLGTAQRVAVSPVPPGASAAPRPVAGTAAYLGLEHVAFRRFGSGPQLLMIGGEDMTMSYWDPALLSSLAQHYEVVLFDLPGVGYSSPPAQSVTLQWWADETAGLIQALGLARPVVLGWGLGGDVALELAETHPTFLSSLVLVDTPVAAPGSSGPSPAIRRELASRWLSMTGLADIWFGASQAAMRSAWLLGMSTVTPDALTLAARDEQLAVAYEVAHSSSLFDKLHLVSVPSLIVYGGVDPIVPPVDATVLQETLPHSRSLEIPNGDYAALMEYESNFVAGLVQFTG